MGIWQCQVRAVWGYGNANTELYGDMVMPNQGCMGDMSIPNQGLWRYGKAKLGLAVWRYGKAKLGLYVGYGNAKLGLNGGYGNAKSGLYGDMAKPGACVHS
ncbi:hypothetical protein CHS0354_004878, partial [Potamilus streckersoni]